MLFYETRLTNATVVDDAIRFVEHNKQQPKDRPNLFSLSSESNDRESEKEPEYSHNEEYTESEREWQERVQHDELYEAKSNTTNSSISTENTLDRIPEWLLRKKALTFLSFVGISMALLVEKPL